MRLLVVAALAIGCSEPPDYSWGKVEGSLVPFFEDPELGCTCRLYFSESQVQFSCFPDSDLANELGYDLTFYATLPASANVRGRSFTEVQLDRLAEWPSSGFGTGAAELGYGSEEFGHPGLSEETQVLKYREVFVWALDIEEQTICSAVDVRECQQLGAGRATDLRFTCGVGY